MNTRPRPCARCKAEIPAERVETLPETRLCVRCSEAVGGEFDVIAVPENLAKAGSLKKNYGGWTIRRKRRDIPPLE
jgi:hypothetical protein